MTAPVYLSINEFPGTGAAAPTVVDFNFAGGYISPAHVFAEVLNETTFERTPVPITDDNFVTAYRLALPVVVPTGSTLRVYRNTPKDAPLVDFTNGARINEGNLDLVAQQATFVAAEAADQLAAFGGTAEALEAAAAAAASAAAATAAVATAAASAETAAASAETAAEKAVIAADFAGAAAESAAEAASAVDGLSAALSASTGAAMVGADDGESGALFTQLQQALDRIHWADQSHPDGVNVLRYIAPSKWPAIIAFTSTEDLTAELHAARDATYWKVLKFPAGLYNHTGISIDPNKGCHWVGVGYDPNAQNGTVLKNTGLTHSIHIQNAGAGNDIPHVFEWMVLNSTAASGAGIKAENEHGIRARGLWIVNHGGSGIELVNAWSNKFEQCVIVHSQQHGVYLGGQCNNVTFDRCIVNANGKLSGYSNISLNAPVGQENLNVNILNSDISYVANASGFNIAITNSFGVNIHGCYSEGGTSSGLIYVGANTLNVSIRGSYLQDGDVTVEGGDAHEVAHNTFQRVYAGTRLLADCSAGSQFKIGPNGFKGGATWYYQGGTGTRKDLFNTAQPSTGSYAKGDVVWNTGVTDGSGGSPVLGWVCTTAGAPGTWTPFGGQAAAQADSTASTVAGLVTDFNLLLAKLRACGLVKT